MRMEDVYLEAEGEDANVDLRWRIGEGVYCGVAVLAGKTA